MNLECKPKNETAVNEVEAPKPKLGKTSFFWQQILMTIIIFGTFIIPVQFIKSGYAFIFKGSCGVRPVSYTHLDVYKRQINEEVR